MDGISLGDRLDWTYRSLFWVVDNRSRAETAVVCVRETGDDDKRARRRCEVMAGRAGSKGILGLPFEGVLETSFCAQLIGRSLAGIMDVFSLVFRGDVNRAVA